MNSTFAFCFIFYYFWQGVFFSFPSGFLLYFIFFVLGRLLGEVPRNIKDKLKQRSKLPYNVGISSNIKPECLVSFELVVMVQVLYIYIKRIEVASYRNGLQKKRNSHKAP